MPEHKCPPDACPFTRRIPPSIGAGRHTSGTAASVHSTQHHTDCPDCGGLALPFTAPRGGECNKNSGQYASPFNFPCAAPCLLLLPLPAVFFLEYPQVTPAAGTKSLHTLFVPPADENGEHDSIWDDLRSDDASAGPVAAATSSRTGGATPPADSISQTLGRHASPASGPIATAAMASPVADNPTLTAAAARPRSGDTTTLVGPAPSAMSGICEPNALTAEGQSPNGANPPAESQRTSGFDDPWADDDADGGVPHKDSKEQ